MNSYVDISSKSVQYMDKDVEAVKNSLRNILYTRKGDLPGNPYFGASLQDYVFELADYTTVLAIKFTVENAIKLWENRVKVIDVIVENIPEYNNIIISVKFSLVEDTNNTQYTLDLKI